MNLSKTLVCTIVLLLSFLVVSCGSDSDSDPIPDGDTDSQESDGDEIPGDTESPEGEIEEEGEAEAEATPLEPFRFVIISDTHVRLPGNPDDADYDNQQNLDNLAAAVATINADYAAADFVAVTGDLAGALFSENVDDYGVGTENPAETFKEMMDQSTIPYYPVLGNHDYQKTYDPEMGEGISTGDILAIEAVWKKVLGIDPYYSVVHKGVRLLFLNANRGDLRNQVCTGCEVEAFCTGSFDEEQLTWLEGEFAQPEPVIIFLHHPLFTDDSKAFFSIDTFLVAEDDPFYSLIEPEKDRILGIFAGHGHIFERDLLYGTIPVYETGSIGDSAGHPENIHVVDFDPEQVRLDISVVREGVLYFGEKAE